MPRTGRVVSLTGYNHIIARGNGGICIFEDDEDRYRILTLFEDKLVGNGIGVIAWCLMSNHFHLMVDDPNGKISSFLRRMRCISIAKPTELGIYFKIDLLIFRSRMMRRQFHLRTIFI